MKYIVRLLRIEHWIKNVLVLFPLVFSGGLLNSHAVIDSLAGYIAFSCAASLVYVINDLWDVEADRKHPTKRNRPIASGKVSISHAIILAIILAVFVFAWNVICGAGIFGLSVLLIYVLMNLAYSARLKRIPVLDVTILAFGFLLRIVYGAIVCGAEVSDWLYLTVLAGSYYLGLGKRRGEIDVAGTESRAVLRGYTREFLDKSMYVFLGLTLAFYALWARESGARLYTVPLVMVIFMRYSLDIESGGDADPMGVVLHDRSLFVLGLVYMVTVLAILYIPFV